MLYEKWQVINLAMIEDRNNPKDFLKGLGLFTPSERLRITFSYMNKICIQEIKLIEFLIDQGSILEIVPLHEKNPIINDNIQSLEDYYGENISVYFEFLDFYQKWLFYPAVGGILTFLISSSFPHL